MVCTWLGKDRVPCPREGTVPQLDKQGAEWGCLCEEHDRKLNDAIVSGDAKRLLGSYIAAKGGAKKCAEQSAKALQPAIVNLVGVLSEIRAANKKPA